MKKPFTILIASVALLVSTNCTKTKETVDNLGCLNKLIKLNNDSDDISCSELTAELTSIQNSCGHLFDDEDRATLALLKASCDE